MRGDLPRLYGPAIIVSNTGRSVRVLETFKEQVVEDLCRAGRRPCPGRVIRYADIPINLLVRCGRLEARSEDLRPGANEKVWPCKCGMEVGIPEAWCTAFPSTGAGYPLHRALVACTNMVEDRREWFTRALGRWNTSRQSEEGS